MKLYNSLTSKLEEFKPLRQDRVGVYTCGPTVYDYVSIGNFRTYFLGDLVVRALRWLDYKVSYIMNITDVGHLTGDNLGDADTGEDRLEKGAKREGKTAFEIAKFYTDDFIKSFLKLNLVKPEKFTLATEYIKEQIELLKKIESKGFTYRIDDGIYFDVVSFEKAGNKYGQLSTLDEISSHGVRVKQNKQKKDSRDFALWKFSPKDKKRQMEWESPWGVGFPGWHLECSAMSMKHLGEQFDVHVGGEDLRSTHHPNEIAQSEAATLKKPFVKYWLHGAFLKVDGGRMGRSLGNTYTLQDLKEKGFSAMDLRYFYLTGHYRKPLNFTFRSIRASKEAYSKLKSAVVGWQGAKTRTKLSEEKLQKLQGLALKFRQAVENDLNMPQALATVWEMVKSNIPDYDKYELISGWDRVLGLDLTEVSKSEVKIPEEVIKLAEKRKQFRQEEKWDKADEVRREIENKGYLIKDLGSEFEVMQK